MEERKSLLTDKVQRCYDQLRKPTYIYFVVVVGDSLDVVMVIFVKASNSYHGLFSHNRYIYFRVFSFNFVFFP